MAVEVAQFLRSKFLILLKEIENDLSELHLISHFRPIERTIKRITVTSSTAFDIRDLLYDLIDSLSDCRVFAYQRQAPRNKALSRLNPLRDRWFSGKIKGRLSEMREKLKRIEQPRDTSPPGLDSLDRPSFPVVDASEIKGFDEEAEKIENLLIWQSEDGLATIGIVGMGGSGKTALAYKVFNSSTVRETYSPTIWVCLSETFYGEEVDLRVRILKYILEELDYNIDELRTDLSIVKLLEEVNSRLVGQRYLIVLDDVWDANEWYADLGYRLPKGVPIGDRFSHGLPKGSGGAIIATSRREQVAEKMVGGKNLIHLDLEPQLSKEICWSIFADTVGRDSVVSLDHHYLVEMEDEISQKCDGLPLAAQTLAEIIPKQIHERENPVISEAH